MIMFNSAETDKQSQRECVKNPDRGGPTNPSEDTAIQTKSLSRKLGQLIAVDRIDLGVKRGQIFGLLGPNGAGKSTTIKMLTTLLEPTSGSANVAGFDVVRQPAQVRRRIGYVPQMVSADGALTGRENLVLSARLHRMPRCGAGAPHRRSPALHGTGRIRTQARQDLFRRNDMTLGAGPGDASPSCRSFSG